MNKTEIIRVLAKQYSKPKKEVLLIVDGFIEEMKKSLNDGERVTLSGFGSFSLSERKGFNGSIPEHRNP